MNHIHWIHILWKWSKRKKKTQPKNKAPQRTKGKKLWSSNDILHVQWKLMFDLRVTSSFSNRQHFKPFIERENVWKYQRKMRIGWKSIAVKTLNRLEFFFFFFQPNHINTYKYINKKRNKISFSSSPFSFEWKTNMKLICLL